jgi:hypothetical protein
VEHQRGVRLARAHEALLIARLPAWLWPFSAHAGWNHVHQQPFQTPLCLSASARRQAT